MSNFSCTADQYVHMKSVLFWVWTYQRGTVVELSFRNASLVFWLRSGFLKDEIRFIDASWIITCPHLHVSLTNFLCLLRVAISESLISNSCFIPPLFFFVKLGKMYSSQQILTPAVPFHFPLFLLTILVYLWLFHPLAYVKQPIWSCERTCLGSTLDFSVLNRKLMWKRTLPGPTAL